MNQTELITLFREDREAAFRRLYREAFPKVARQIAQRNGTLEEAKDVFHESLITLFEKCRTEELQIRGSVIHYILGMCRNQYFNYLRQKQKEVSLDDFSETAYAATETGTAGNISLLKYLEKAGKKCLDLLQAVYYFKYSMQEVAEEFGFRTVRSATVQKYKCMEKVRHEVAKREDETVFA
jgi:RNA polymerase sigma factor (sigma-70 family)